MAIVCDKLQLPAIRDSILDIGEHAESYYIHSKNGVIIAFYNELPECAYLPTDDKIFQVVTNRPSAFMGIDETTISNDPLVPISSGTISELQKLRSIAKDLYMESQFASNANDPDKASILQDYRNARKDYRDLRDA